MAPRLSLRRCAVPDRAAQPTHSGGRERRRRGRGRSLERFQQRYDEARIRLVDTIDDRKAVDREDLVDLRHLLLQMK